ncbi:LicD family protein [Xenorhabdus griffiniae]|uniref:LicD family protein n=1 Tax=Xenorhabdus griffiniae TaxID=351672 RepID=UPI0023581B10|nr:LicD family protein [Xenorhabdus griffiniae]MDC9603970.1 LicD family protein [Xenorhabdus griffiniae]
MAIKEIKEYLNKNAYIRYVRYILIPSIFTYEKEVKRNKRYHKYNLSALYAFQEAMNDINKNFWLDWGTLLGAIRENNFIEHDNDLDFGMYLSDFSSEVEASLIKKGFKKIKKFEKKDGITALELTYSFKGVQVDIFFYQPQNDHMICHHFGKFDDPIMNNNIKEGTCITFQNYCPQFELTDFEFQGRVFSIPKNTIEYLTNYYGTDFMKPVIETEYIPDKYSYTKPIGVGKYYLY